MQNIELNGLIEIVGAANVLRGADAAPHLVDWRHVFDGEALAVVRPANTDEVAAVVRWCIRHDVVIVTQGGNTGLSGGAIPMGPRPSIVVSLRRMNAIEAVEPGRSTMTVQAGVTIEAMHEAAAGADRQFAPDWGARGTATIGGAIATDAGGNNVVRYGNMREQVMGLEVVLADGRVWNGLRALRKDSSGYDLKHLFVGSEGTLGVITRAVVKLRPATPHAQTAMAALSEPDRLMDLFALTSDIAADSLVAFELMPDVGVEQVCATFELARPLETRADFSVLIKLAGTHAVSDLLTDVLSQAADAELITDAVVAATSDQEERLWTIRDHLPPMGLYRHHGIGLKMDAAVPIDRMVEFHDGVRSIAAEVVPGALAYGFGHVGDGNLHMNVLPVDDEQVEAFRIAKPELVRRVDDLTFRLGGTLSAEHGIGRELRGRVEGQKPAIEWELMRAIKTTFDPDDRLNPDVLLPPAGD